MPIEVIGMVLGGVITVGVAVAMVALITHARKPPPWDGIPQVEPYKCDYCSLNGIDKTKKSPLK